MRLAICKRIKKWAKWHLCIPYNDLCAYTVEVRPVKGRFVLYCMSALLTILRQFNVFQFVQILSTSFPQFNPIRQLHYIWNNIAVPVVFLCFQKCTVNSLPQATDFRIKEPLLTWRWWLSHDLNMSHKLWFKTKKSYQIFMAWGRGHVAIQW